MRPADIDSNREPRSDSRSNLAQIHEIEQSRLSHAEREEVEARTRLLRAEAMKVEADVGHVEAETAHIDSKVGDLDFTVFRKAVFFVLAVAIAMILIIRLLADPSAFHTVEIGGAAGLLSWLSKL